MLPRFTTPLCLASGLAYIPGMRLYGETLEVILLQSRSFSSLRRLVWAWDRELCRRILIRGRATDKVSPTSGLRITLFTDPDIRKLESRIRYYVSEATIEKGEWPKRLMFRTL